MPRKPTTQPGTVVDGGKGGRKANRSVASLGSVKVGEGQEGVGGIRDTGNQNDTSGGPQGGGPVDGVEGAQVSEDAEDSDVLSGLGEKTPELDEFQAPKKSPSSTSLTSDNIALYDEFNFIREDAIANLNRPRLLRKDVQ